MSENKTKFFFEEDSATEDSTLSWGEHADTFTNTLEEAGITKQKLDLTPSEAVVDMKMDKIANNVLLIEYGTVGEDYVIHVTPTHPVRNLKHPKKLRQAIEACILAMNEVVPYTVRVEIFLPDETWEVKATTFKIPGGTAIWNLDTGLLSAQVVPKILDKVTATILSP